MGTGTEGRSQTILVIDDSQDIHDLIDVRLKAEPVQIHHALDAESGLRAAQALRPDVVLLDLDMPGKDGLSLCKDLKSDPELEPTIVIFLTGNLDVGMKVQAFDSGAADYVTKPFDAVELRARVRTALRTKRYFDLLATRAQIDGLTGLWNRRRFDEVLAEEFALWRREGRHWAIALLDIDHFKSLNDNYGHPFGDLVLRRVGDTLRSHLRQSEAAFRYGGEEFVIVLRACDLEGAFQAAERIRAAVAALELAHGTTKVEITGSFGVAATDLGRLEEATDLVTCADQALYLAKRGGRNRVVKAVRC
jgi:two-component system, cell cycle response regulator